MSSYLIKKKFIRGIVYDPFHSGKSSIQITGSTTIRGVVRINCDKDKLSIGITHRTVYLFIE